MKKAFNLFTVAIFGGLLLATSCNLDKDDTPQDYYNVAAIQTSSSYPYSEYLLLGDGTKLLTKNTVLPGGIKSGDLAYVQYTIESEHTVNDTNQFQFTISVKDATKLPISNVITRGLDTLGKGAFTGLQPYAVGDFMWVKFSAHADNTHRFFVAKDSVALVGTDYGLVRKDTMFLEIRHRDGNNTYSEGFGDLFINLKNAVRQSPIMPTDSVTVSVKYNSENTGKPNYKYLRFKANSY